MLAVPIRSDVCFMTWKAFAKRNIELPFPQRDLHLHGGIPWEKLDLNSKTETIEREMKEEKPQHLVRSEV